jgi:hypothetical protein
MGGRITAFWVDQVHKFLAICSTIYGRVDFYSWPACVPLGIRYETGPCYHLAFSYDGQRAVTLTEEGIKEWDSATGAELGLWKRYLARLTGEAFSSPRLYYDQANQPKLIRMKAATMSSLIAPCWYWLSQ